MAVRAAGDGAGRHGRRERHRWWIGPGRADDAEHADAQHHPHADAHAEHGADRHVVVVPGDDLQRAGHAHDDPVDQQRALDRQPGHLQRAAAAAQHDRAEQLNGEVHLRVNES